MITINTLAAIFAGKQDSDRIHVIVKDPTGYIYPGHVADFLRNSYKPRESTCTIVADDGEVVWNVLVSRILSVDVRPLPDGH